MSPRSIRTVLAIACGVTAAAALPGAAAADDAPGSAAAWLSEAKLLLNYRLRYEAVDQANFARDAEALTSRIRAGVETGPVASTRVLVEAEWVADIVDRYNSGTNGRTGYPTVSDPAATEINRLQLTNTALPGTTIVLGRQRLSLDDERFIGPVGWRQNEQTFDALSIAAKLHPSVTVQAAYIEQVNRILGPESAAGRYHGDTWLANAAWKTPYGTLTGFAYLIDLEDNAANSSRTFGARFSGMQPVGPVKLTYAASYARQSDYRTNPLDYTADYYLAEGGLGFGGWSGSLGYELLSGNGRKGFATPLATLHKFQGWADMFLNTPADGIQDVYGRLGYSTGPLGPLKSLALTAFYHDFNADRGGRDYGQELDLQVQAQWQKFTFTLKFADYDAATFASDTQKLWFSVDYVY